MDSFEKISNSLLDKVSSIDSYNGKRSALQIEYEAQGEHTGDAVAAGYRKKGLSIASFRSFNWSYVSRGIGESLSLHLKATVLSLPHVPSKDRVSSAFQMSVNLQSMIMGTSLLSLPFCLKIAGVWSLLLIFVIGIFTTFTADILSDCLYQESFSKAAFKKRVNTSFVDMAKSCWKKVGCYIMEVLVYLSLLRNIVILILLTDISSELLNDIIGSNYDKKVLSVLWSFAVLPLLFIKKISALTCLSFIGLNIYLLAVLSVLVLCCLKAPTWDIRNISFDFNLQGLGITAGIVVNSFSVHLNMPALEGSLRKPTMYKKSVNVTYAINVCTKIGFALCGYLTCLQETGQEITSQINLHPPLPSLVRASVMFFAFFSIPLQSIVVFELIDNNFRPHFPLLTNHSHLWFLISRLLLMTVCLFAAVTVPHFSIAVSLIGSLRGTVISLILPPLFYVTLKTHEKKTYKSALCYVTIAIGLCTAIIGAYSSFSALVRGIEK